MKRYFVSIAMGVAGVVALCSSAVNLASAASSYSDGSYSDCTYETGCTISLASNGNVSLPVVSSGGITCTTAGDVVRVTTNSATGYNLQLSTSGATNVLDSGSGTIAAASGTQASPAPLGANRWGYRIDNVGGFGAGPTAAGTNTGVPAVSFAAVPVLAAPNTIKTTAAPATDDPTNLWYGVCVDAATTAGSYTGTATYTAIVN